MSLEGYYSSPINAAIEDLVQRLGVVVVASAGNHNADACTVSPASANSAIAVGAINVDGSRWYRSNWGPCMDLFAPGVNVVSAVPWTDSSEAPKTGTSMAAPFVTGVAALYLENHQGASPADAAQRLLRSSMMGAVTDDTSGMATFTPTPRSSGWGPIDISSTPNRLLQSVLTIPARLLPSVITVAATSGAPGPSASAAAGRDITVSLLLQPSGQVNVTASVPNAWTGQPLATIFPSALTFTAENYNREQRLLLQPNAAAAQGAYYVQLAMRSSDPRFDFAVQVVKVDDAREQVGETAAVPRVIRSLPFNDSGATISFRHDYNTSAGNPKDTAPDVVYAYTPAFAMTVTASTCGSTYDTVLLLGQAPLRLAETLANDDDPACGSASRIDTDLQPGRTYYVVVSGFNGAAGDFALSVRCTSCDGAGGGSGGGGGLPAASRR
ncbi:hypothetical protein PLESTB_000213700 [Pleodorina starrii]|uniref:Peptidase S8/S53 domain-containing protein n=1 Tax=Pleodorina starrii TaxID=330485 RepID=A0A9W6BCT0_9CHLO|nr:hypothetical protein PLESTM_001539400 [Pleodorina starrii]GLC49385.1 hypothetical protein PLESTB_000213700 [Pleodorina starrii]GLC73353.1 hypothetical protein PLESTF_001366300 [Pleodorina starrii]